MCGQFADLMQAVNGTNTYEILVALAAGDQPPPVRRRNRANSPVAASFVLRRFTDARVRRVPPESHVQRIRERYAITSFKPLYRRGQRLSDQDLERDGYSYRYAVINMAGQDRESLLANFEVARLQLDFEFDEPIQTDLMA
jgi:hypothetical protein